MTRDLLRRLIGVLFVAPVVALAVLIAGVTPAAAHASLSEASPRQGSQLDAAPDAVTLTFSEEVGLSDRSVQVVDSQGRRVDDGRPQHPGGDSRTVRVGLLAGLGTGS